MADGNQRTASSALEDTQDTISRKARARRDRPCDACRRRKNRCIKIAGEPNLCVLCQARAAKCTFVQSPPPKKRRRLDEEESSPNAAKPRYVLVIFMLRHIVLFTNVSPYLKDHLLMQSKMPSALKRPLTMQISPDLLYLRKLLVIKIISQMST